MSQTSKGGRPKGSKSAHPLGLIDVAVGDHSGGVSRAGAVYGMHENIAMSTDEIEEIKARRLAEKRQADKDARAARFALALDAVVSGNLNVSQASTQFDVHRGTLTAHAVAVAAGKVPRQSGRPALMSEEHVREMIEIVEDRDLHKDSIRKEDWPDVITNKLDKINGPGGGHSKKHESSYDAKTIRAYRDKIAPEKVRKGYDQNQARFEALAELYHQIAFAVAVRMALGYLFATGKLGRDDGEEPPGRNPSKLYNADASSTFCADELPSQVRMASSSKAKLKSKGRSSASTKSKDAPPLQRRSIQYFIVAGIDRVLAAVILMKDKSWSDLRLFRSERKPQYFLVCEGSGVSKQELAERVEFEIINVVISEDSQRVDREDSYGPAIEMGQEEGNAYRLLSPDLHPEHHHPPDRDGFGRMLGSDDDADEEEHVSAAAMMIGVPGDSDDDQDGDLRDSNSRQEMEEGEEGDAEAGTEDSEEELERLWQEMFNRPLFCQDGERNFLAAVLSLLEFDRLCFDLIKSGGSCTAFQQLMDRVKSFLQIRGFYNGAEFRKILQLPDADIPKTSLIKEWEDIFKPVDPASRRVFLRFLYTFPTQVDKHITELTLRKGWRDIFVYPFNQRGMFEVVPAYSKLTDEEKEELDSLMPGIVAECIKDGSANASDEVIYKHVGHIVGPPRRGLPGDTDAARAPRIVDLDEGEGEGEEEVEEQQPARKKGTSGPKKRAVMSLQRMFFNRWRAAYFTPDSYRKALAEKAQHIVDTALAKERKAQTVAEEKAKKAEDTANKKAAKTDAKREKDAKKELGPRIRVARDKSAVERCHECLTTYAEPPFGQESLWTGCEHCDERWACDDPECKEALDRHEAKCKQKRIEAEETYQMAVDAAPRQEKAAVMAPKAPAKKYESEVIEK
jgi:hypothetical protein